MHGSLWSHQHELQLIYVPTLPPAQGRFAPTYTHKGHGHFSRPLLSLMKYIPDPTESLDLPLNDTHEQA